MLTIVTKMGDEELRVANVMLTEMLAIQAWTGFDSKDEWLVAFNAGNVLAVQAGYALAVWRNTGEKPRLGSLNFDLDTMDSHLIDDTGAKVMFKVDQNEDGTMKTDEKGKPQLVLDVDGNMQMFYVDTGEPVPPTGEVVESTTTSPTPPTSGKPSVSRSRTQK